MYGSNKNTLTISGQVIGGTPTRVLFVGATGLLDEDPGFTYLDATNQLLLGNNAQAFVAAFGFAGSFLTCEELDTVPNGNAVFTRLVNSAAGPNFTFIKGRGTVAAPIIVQNSDSLGSVVGQGIDSATTRVSSASIQFQVDGVPGTPNDMPGRIMFLTTPDGSGTSLEAFRINNAQQCLFQVDRGARFENQTDAAGVAGGTLLNAPAAGNPTFWLKVTINGGTLAIPCWPG